MGRQNVVAREYKVMLRSNRFAGNKKALLKKAASLWRDLSENVKPIALEVTGGFTQILRRRLITFRDTSKQHLNKSSYIFRERSDVDGVEREVTLKFRHADLYFTQNRSMDSRGGKARTKFEEDIKAPFLSLYSFSTTVEIEGDRSFDGLGDVAQLFPDLSERLEDFREEKALVAVNGFTARELVIGGATLQVRKTPRADAEVALIVWYDEMGRKDKPVAVELSFRYGDPAGDYGGTMARRAFDIFRGLQKGLGKWIDPRSRTKTAFVYG